MNVRHPMEVLHSFSIKNIFHGKMDLRLFYFCVTICLILLKTSGSEDDGKFSEILTTVPCLY